MHPLANVLKTQGLLNDTARGLTTSSMQRESVNSIFGVNTPGKYTGDKVITGADKNAKQVTQRGGHVFVMDGYGGQTLTIDFDTGRIVTTLAVHRDFNWMKIAHSVIKKGK